eukprot:NODE_3650_length_926_cov_9.138924_g3498_i0.p2 GENE.NODE_3650_length_926_cov_9.138924_g3498_i0~~NODE_3650_length_926_cov_9.138924_g3498_i0.p2  ORF type:complete len:295 (-),score=88.10 NODE_3650_length_926_cov_9.138924_g3498_i0:41-871(-)
MKVYLQHEGTETTPEFKVKITLPSKWLAGPLQRVIDLFVKQYAQKHPEHPLDPAELDIRNSKRVILPAQDLVSEHVTEYMDLFITPRQLQEVASAPPAGSVQCKNFGCQQWFMESENHEKACTYHGGAPVFHDLSKYWTCCAGKKAWDWEEFQAIPGCEVGPHSTAQKEVFKPSVAEVPMSAPLTQEQLSAPAPAPPAPRVDTPGPIVDGKAKCRNQGCQAEFVVADNTEQSCHYHSGAPVFHDANKYWSCCSQKKCWDWDEFMLVPPCTIGLHKV